MSPALVLMCSPHAGGVTDTLAESFAAGLEDAGWPAGRIPLRAHPVLPCTGCGVCARPPQVCVLATQDDAEWLFARFMEAPLVLLASPIFFYALPATFKAWIDRSQRFWAPLAERREAGSNRGEGAPTRVPVLALLAAGRPRGRELFSGALRTLRWFVPLLGGRLVENRVFRGLDHPDDIQRHLADLDALRAWGRAWAHRLAAKQGEATPL